ncbi:MAG TPA: histidine kinase dimerization/phospho-acceptor domain-containing protein, partial [Polyangiaceae bacterium]|nr:histidine kinase dimerization/phospho-acceptor domain-containing protein [Polyangiaceae bacterium]
AYEEERRKAEALAEIDRAKTAFFSNVSHEFRTPLTLILGPIEDALARSAGGLNGESLQAVHRSALRLLRLVNSLLDFSRIEAGRLQPSFEPTDLASLTVGLAGSFRSLIESAGLKFLVDCPPLAAQVHVDRAQWEKIVLNLLSNAFKFTFEGEIAVRLRGDRDRVELLVSDTGTGIPEHELPRIFDRFHRVEGARGRSFEGTGIGLALVRELVQHHAGSVRVESCVGRGTTFVVSIPTGTEHLPKDRLILDRPAEAAPALSPYVLEASHWTPNGHSDHASAGAGVTRHLPSGSAAAVPADTRCVLVADDNADMREYLVRLLGAHWRVETVEDGEAALARAVQNPPDLILSDVMMPRLDGFGLLKAIRANPTTTAIPVVLLSARAGEEAMVEGLERGADDYLVKPFSARELLARVRANLEMAALRRDVSNAATQLAATRAALLRDLERKNKELDAFNYSVSHDLRAPLRSIDGFSRALLDDCAGALDALGQEHLQRIRTATRRMGALIDDLLSLSRIERIELRRVSTDLSRLALRVSEELGRLHPDRRVECT